MSQSPGDWYKSLPPVCRAWGTACVLTTVGVQLGVLDLRALYLDFPSVFKRFQIWRLLTNFCFVGGFGFPFVMRIMMMCVSLSVPVAPEARRTRAYGVPASSSRRDSRHAPMSNRPHLTNLSLIHI